MNHKKTAFDAIGQYYDLLYHDKNYEKETVYVLDLLKKISFSGKDVLEFGSGTGIHGRLLAQQGLNILGVEMSQTMLDRSFDIDGFRSVLGDARDFRVDSKFDMVLSLFHVVSYQVSDKDVEAIFQNASRHLKTGGVFIFDCWYSAAVSHQGPSVKVKRLETEEFELVRIAEPEVHEDRNLVNVNYTVFIKNKVTGVIETFTELHSMRHFSIPEMDRIAKNSGFEKVKVESFLDGKKPDSSTWGVCFVYRKITND